MNTLTKLQNQLALASSRRAGVAGERTRAYPLG